MKKLLLLLFPVILLGQGTGGYGGGGGGAAGVSSLNGLTGDLTLAAANGITWSAVGATITPGVGPSIMTTAVGQAGKPWFCSSTNGTTAFTCSLAASQALTAYTKGMWLLLVTDTDNTSSCPSLNVDTVGIKGLFMQDGATCPPASTVKANQPYWIYYNGTAFELQLDPTFTTIVQGTSPVSCSTTAGVTTCSAPTTVISTTSMTGLAVPSGGGGQSIQNSNCTFDAGLNIETCPGGFVSSSSNAGFFDLGAGTQPTTALAAGFFEWLAPASIATSYRAAVPNAAPSGTQALECGTPSGTANISTCSWVTPSGSGTVTTTGSPASGNLAKFSGATSITNGDLAGDATTSGTLTTTVAKVNGVAYGSSPSTDSVPVITASNTETYKVVADCQDSAGNHLNYTQSTHAFSCGTSASAAGITTNPQSGTSYTFLTGDNGKLVSFSSAAAVAATLPQCTSAGFAATWFVKVGVTGTGAVVITPTTSTLDGKAAIVLAQESGVSTIVCDAGGNYFSDRVTTGSPIDTHYVRLQDEFMGGTTSTGNIGSLGWNVATISGAPSMAGVAGVWPNIGLLKLTTNAAASSSAELTLSPANSVNSPLGAIGSNFPWEFKYIFKLEQTTNNRMRVGTCIATNSVLGGNAGYFLRMDQNTSAPPNTAADTNFTYETRTGGNSTISATTTAVDSSYHTISISAYAVGKLQFKFDGGQVKTFCSSGCTVTATIDTTAMEPCIIFGNDTTGTTASMDMDFFGFAAIVSTAASGERQ